MLIMTINSDNETAGRPPGVPDKNGMRVKEVCVMLFSLQVIQASNISQAIKNMVLYECGSKLKMVWAVFSAGEGRDYINGLEFTRRQ